MKYYIPALWLLGSIVFPNLVFVLVASHFGLGRPYVNFDYVVCAVIYFTPLRVFFYPLVLVSVFVDAVLLVGQVFPFIRLQDVLYLLGFIPSAALAWQVILCALVLGVLLFFLAFSYSVRKTSLLGCLLVLNFMLLPYLFSVYGGDVDRGKFWRVSQNLPVSSQIVYFYNYRQGAFLEKYFEEGSAFSAATYKGATDQWFGFDTVVEDKVLLVVNESWGVPLDPHISESLIAPIRALKNVEILDFGARDFVGATVAGELRELCRLQPNHFNLANVSDGFDECLPNKFKKMGYSTHSLHGAVGLMYDRVHWYPRVGFDDRVFFESKAWKERCYSFPGACDLELMSAQVAPILKKEGREFVYWLTLNTHSFYDSRDLRGDYFDCAAHGVLRDGEACRNLKLQAQFFKGLAGLLSEVSAGLDVIVVGDHSPPMFDQAEKDSVFADSKVSYLRLKVR